MRSFRSISQKTLVLLKSAMVTLHKHFINTTKLYHDAKYQSSLKFTHFSLSRRKGEGREGRGEERWKERWKEKRKKKGENSDGQALGGKRSCVPLLPVISGTWYGHKMYVKLVCAHTVFLLEFSVWGASSYLKWGYFLLRLYTWFLP